MLRVVTLLLALLAACPAMAQSDEAANALFVQVMREIQAAPPLRTPVGDIRGCRGFSGELVLGYREISDAAKRRHAALASARAKLEHLVDKYPGSRIAVLLMTREDIGKFNLENLDADIAAAKTCIASPAEIEQAEAARAEEERMAKQRAQQQQVFDPTSILRELSRQPRIQLPAQQPQ